MAAPHGRPKAPAPSGGGGAERRFGGTSVVDDNRASRDAVLASVRKALGRTAASERGRADALAYIAAHRQGPRPAMPADLVARFLERATDMASTVARIAS